MRKNSISFLKIKVYRRKFLGTTIAILLLCTICFIGVTTFFTNIWAGQQRQEAQDAFSVIERKIGTIKDQLNEYIEGCYASRTMMQDAMALFAAGSEEEYLEKRLANSRSTSAQISYMPGDMKKLFINNRTQIRGATFISESGIKAVWQDRVSGDMHVTFDLDREESALGIPGFGDMILASYEIRDPDSIGRQLGRLTFWVDRDDLFRGVNPSGAWAVMQEGKPLHTDYTMEKEWNWIRAAENLEESQGAFFGSGYDRIFYTVFPSSQYNFSYICVINSKMLWRLNRSALIGISFVLIILAGGAVLVSFVGIRNDARFLSYIMQMLGAMENGDFSVAKNLEIHTEHKNEYGRIAIALKDVSQKLEGYIRTEYVMKLKQQEAAMRALKHQINPHFLYNTLESIRSKALVCGDEETAEAITQLGSLYRKIVHCPDVITMKEEKELLELYLRLMSLRFAGNFVYQLELEKDLEGVRTPGFWLQPLAENFFSHGFDRNNEFNLLILEIRSEGGGVRALMTDNGLGIAREQLEAIRKHMHEGSDDLDADIGLRNVYMRLQYFYGEDFTMEIGNNPEGGARISVYIPTQAGKEETDVHVVDCG
ncbi:sensor histidine kinase [Lachnospiraceae bacterium TF09-5]|nr:sensor histidine kinase [Lachnospiraceae bacterium TF09-5]